MKKVMSVIFASMYFMMAAAMVDNDKIIQFVQLPAQAKVFISSHFKELKVATTKMDTEFMDKKYDVIFTTGEKVEFNKNGVWTEVKCVNTPVPEKIIPVEIKSYMRQNYPGVFVKGIEHDKKGYDVELSNGLDIEFNNNFQVVDIDD